MSEQLREYLLLPEDLCADIQSHRQPRRAGLGKGRSDLVVICCQGVRSGIFVVKQRQGKVTVPVEQHGRRPVGGNRNRVDRCFGIERGKAIDDEAPPPLDVRNADKGRR